MKPRSYVLIIFSALHLMIAAAGGANATVDVNTFVNLSLKAIRSIPKAEDRRGARELLSQQLLSLSETERLEATGSLLSKIRTEDAITRNEVAQVLAALKTPWATKNQEADTDLVYGQFLIATDVTLKTALDNALVNAKGLYRDAIFDYNTDHITDLNATLAKFRTMANKFPKSRYAENASFYAGQFLTRAYFLKDPKGKQLVRDSNIAFEEYIRRAEAGEFAKTDFLSSGYLFRAMNGLILGNVSDARDWLTKGAKKFSDQDRDQLYVYQFFYTTDKKLTVDNYFHAKSLFTNFLEFLKQHPNSSPEHQDEIVTALTGVEPPAGDIQVDLPVFKRKGEP